MSLEKRGICIYDILIQVYISDILVHVDLSLRNRPIRTRMTIMNSIVVKQAQRKVLNWHNIADERELNLSSIVWAIDE